MAKSFAGLGATICDSSADLPAASADLEGLLYFQKDTNELKICNGSSWISMLDTDNPPSFRITPVCQVYRSTDLSYTADTDIVWNAENIDTDFMFNPSSANITVKTAGIYWLNFYTYITCAATLSTSDPRILRNGSPIVRGAVVAATTTSVIVQTTTLANLTVNDVLTCRAVFNGGSSYVIKGINDPYSALASKFQLSLIGKLT